MQAPPRAAGLSAARSGCTRSSRWANSLTRRSGWTSYHACDNACRRARCSEASAVVRLPSRSRREMAATYSTVAPHQTAIRSSASRMRRASFRCGSSTPRATRAEVAQKFTGGRRAVLQSVLPAGLPEFRRLHARARSAPSRDSRSCGAKGPPRVPVARILASSSTSSASFAPSRARPTGTIRATGVLRSRTSTDSPDLTRRR